jgi:hypothetical protein
VREKDKNENSWNSPLIRSGANSNYNTINLVETTNLVDRLVSQAKFGIIYTVPGIPQGYPLGQVNIGTTDSS